MDRLTDRSPVVEFGRFKVDPHRREFLVDGRPVELGGRAFDTLLALIERPGTVLGKDELMRRIWPDRVVEENNLEIQIWSLRKALGVDRDLIRTVVGRGYQFTGNIRVPDTAGGAATLATQNVNLPAPVSELIGREAEAREVLNLVTAHRLVTLSGPGGIGKTRLAVEVAEQLLPAFPDGVFLADLAPLSDPALVPVTVAAALKLRLVADAASPEQIGAAVGPKRLLLVLDNCEHLVDAAARMAEALLGVSPRAVLLATSREPLRADGEYVYRVPPLALPAEDVHADEVFRHDAVRLFVARAHAAEPRFVPEATVAFAVAAICRRLDGMPLAIELAAARVALLGVAGVASRLDDRFTLLTSGKRTALPRHQTLRATLDWSYELLSEHQRMVLRRLAVFAGSFVLEAATEVAAGVGLSADDVVDGLAGLVSRSLVSADLGDPTHYRLLETTRAYGLEKLTESGELDGVARRHAEYHCTLCERTELEQETSPPEGWMAVYGRQLDNVRLALNWSFSPTGDAPIGVALTLAAVPLWVHLSLMTECRVRVQEAIASLEPQAPSDTRRDMRLFLAMGTALLHIRGTRSPEIGAALTKALELAESLGDTDYCLRAMFGLFLYRFITGDYRVSLAIAERFATVAGRATDPSDALIGRRLIGTTLHVLGDQSEARRHVEPVINADFAASRRSHIVRYQFDQRVLGHCYYARILWLQGFVDQALRVAESVVDDARTSDHLTSLLFALHHAACPVALHAGDLAAADHYVKLLMDFTVKHGLETWRASGQCFEGVLRIKRGDSVAGARLLRAALAEIPPFTFHIHAAMLLAELAEGLGGAGQIAEGLAVIDDALDRAERTEGRWCIAEQLRTKGELLLLRGASAAAADAEECFRRALDWARRQGALWWELGSATSLARLYHRQRRTALARKVLSPVYRRFTEGFKAPAVAAAKALLESFRSPVE